MESEYKLEIDEKEHAFGLLQSLAASRRDEENCDLIIRIGKQEIHVHRNIMSAASDYFKAMLFHDTVESETGVVEMKDVEYDIVAKCVEFIYTGKITITARKCEGLLHVASMLQLNPLCAKIAPFLESHLNSKSFFDIKRIATKFDLENLHTLCDDFALKNLDLIAKEEQFCDLEMEYVSFLISSKVSTSAGSEDAKLAIILRWIKADVPKRQEHLSTMMELLDLKRVSLSYGKYVAMVEPICNKSLECMKLLYLAALNRCNVEAKPAEIAFESLNDRDSILLFNEPARLLQAYEVSTGKWTMMHGIYEEIMNEYYTTQVIGNNLYVMCASKRFYMLDLTEKFSRWFQFTDLGEEHGRYIRSATLDEKIYVVGGDSIEKFNRKQSDWQKIDSGRVACDRCAIVECDGWIYTIGGFRGEEIDLVFKMSPSSLTWTSVKPMQVSRATPAATVHDDKIYVAGGYLSNFLAVFECYEPKTNCWTLLSPMRSPRSNFALSVLNGKIFAIGCGTKLLSMEVFDPDKRMWEDVEMRDITVEAPATTSFNLAAITRASF